MINTYEYSYNWDDASAKIQIDTDKLTKDDCISLLKFFTWKWNEDECPYTELARLYCRTAMSFATCNNHNKIGVLMDFKEAEGFPELDGSYGITLIQVDGLDFSEIEIECDNITTNN